MKKIKITLAFLVSAYMIMTLSLFISGNFILDIISNLTLYLLFLSFTFLTLLFVYLAIKKKFRKALKVPIFIAFVLLSFTFILVSGFNLASFYYFKDSSREVEGKTLRIAFLNTLYNNENYEDISKEIRSANPDILGLGEINPERLSKVEALKDYSYSVTDPNFRSKDIAIFSKYPIEQLTSIDSDTDFFIAGKVNIEKKEYNIIVAHPVPPLNQYWYGLREKVLDKLITRINKIDSSNTILIGDFNLTPVSPIYKNFVSAIPQLKNASQGQGVQATWNDLFIKLHIDHIFIPKKFEVIDYKVLGNAGSDHKMVFTKVKLSN